MLNGRALSAHALALALGLGYATVPSSAHAIEGLNARAHGFNFGAGRDGYFSMPTPSTSANTTCDLGTQAAVDVNDGAAECPNDICATCSIRSGGTSANGCLCAISLSSAKRWASTMGGYGTNSYVSAMLELTRFTLGKKNKLTIDRTPANGCSNGDGSVLWLKVAGDALLQAGTASAGDDAVIDMRGKGGCGGQAQTSTTTATSTAGANGCNSSATAAWAGGAGGASGANAGGAGQAPKVSTWHLGQSEALLLLGPGGAKATKSGETSCANILSPFEMIWSGSGGGSGGCGSAGCSSVSWDPGAGGGGVILDVGGTLTVGDYADIDTRGEDATGVNVGGSGGGSILLRYVALSEGTGVSYLTTGGAGGSSCNGGTGCGAGGTGGSGVTLKAPIP